MIQNKKMAKFQQSSFSRVDIKVLPKENKTENLSLNFYRKKMKLKA